MRRRTLNFFLLPLFLYWTSGLGQCLHEKYEHWHPDQDEIPTCQTLKAMKARSPDAPKAPEPSLPSVEKFYMPHRGVPVLYFVVFIPARAPPVVSFLGI